MLLGQALWAAEHMLEAAITTNKIDLYNILHECIAKKNLVLGWRVHSILVCCGYESNNTFGGQLIRLYSAFGLWQEAKLTFGNVARPTLCSWSAIIGGYARINNASKALELYKKMQQNGIKPNNEVFLCTLKVCCSQGLISIPDATELLQRKGIYLSNNIITSLLQGCLKKKNLSACCHLLQVMKSQNLQSVALFGSQLIQAFTSCGSLQAAKNVFEMITKPSTYTWNAIISAHVQLGESEQAINMFFRMQQEGTPPNEFIFTCSLKACSAIEEVEMGRAVHHHIIVCHLECNTAVGNALVDLYSKGRDVEDAFKVFDTLEHPDVVSWGSMAVCFSHHGLDMAVVKLYDCMDEKGYSPNRVVFLHVLKACRNVGALGHGRLLHAALLRYGLQADPLLGSVLVQMYASCGNIEELQSVFKGICARDAVDWGAMICGLVQQGEYQALAEYLDQMLREGLKPDAVILTGILTACTRAGLLAVGIQNIMFMIERFAVALSTTHYNCLVDLHARMGLLEEAKNLLYSKPGFMDIIGWKSILSSCRRHCNANLGAQCLDVSVQIDPHDSAGYVLLSGIYADVHS